ncbi:hypothetical protein VHA01S_008_00530 [Vibrio halioticoli NBRC 102217]|uniref:Uncharacterized protein n=1 Tax=Vibrio halioticoli NBRC 102217 TaxID=1219072 RepID=V5FI14_9VIBR|nr:hypothetical protein [Vibrio halioticoli]GAD88657.1 hypothetical protein VHA01S_008_00530 [Vibrio halioticoli NBRC 102217]
MNKTKKPSGVSRRLLQAIKHLSSNDYEGALVNLFPAIDQTAKRRRPKDGVGKRVKSFLEDEEKLISIVATGNCFSKIVCDGISVTDALYKFGRTSIVHEGELDPRIQFNLNGAIEIGSNKWNLSIGYITGMCVAVIVSYENHAESIEEQLAITVFGKQFPIESLWGNSRELKNHICREFRDSTLFLEN